MSRQESLDMIAKGEIPERYQKNIGTIGIKGQQQLLEARAVVIGAGGLGSTVIELLARQGVGWLRIIDGDSFTWQNLNRQLLATERTLGMQKASVAASRVAEINSDIEVEATISMLNNDNAVELIRGADVIIDAVDSISCRMLICRIAQLLKIPLVYAAVAGFVGQVGVIMPDGPSLDKIYKANDGLDKGIERFLGVLTATPALAAAIQVQEVVKLLTGVGEPLTSKLLYFDIEQNIYELLSLES